MLTALALIVGVALCGLGIIALVGANQAVADITRERDTAVAALRELIRPVVEDELNDRLHLVWSQPEVTPLDDDAPIYLDALAWSEAARADWDEPTRWQR